MATSSIHIGTSSSGALIHNERIFSPDYLISNDKNINEYKSYTNLHISELEKLAKIDYQKHSINNRKLPKTATLIKEAILNLNENHTLKDLEKVKDTLENEYGYKISNISIHRDEGYIYTDTKNYTMGKNQFKNLEETPHIAELDLKDNKFYEWNLKNNKWVKGEEIKDYKIEKNYHAHVVMLNYDFSKHRTIRNNLKDLSKMQTLVARDLGMERGKCSSIVEAQRIGVEVEQSRKRINIKEYKVQKRKEKELEKELEKEKNKNIKLEKELYNFREMQKTITALELTSDEKKELHRLNSQVKNQNATIEELLKKIDTLTVENKDLKSLTSNLAAESVENFEKAEQLKAKEIDLETALKEVSNLKKSYTILESNYETSKNNNVSLISKNATLSIENKKLEKEDLSNKSLISTLTKETVTLQNQVNTLKSENKALQEEIKQKPIQTIQNNQIEVLSYSKAESDLSQDFYSMIEKREFKTGLMSKEDFTIIKKQEVGTPTILEVIKSHFKNMYNSLHQKIKSLTVENINLKKANLDLQIENLKLTNENNKDKTLSITGTGEKKENLFERVKKINENEKILKEQIKPKEKEEVKENVNTKTQNYGYELR